MTSNAEVLEAVVVGAGSAGLAVSHALIRAGIPHRVLERGRIGETWRTQRWDSFRMNTPNSLTVMPGDTYDGPDPDGSLTRDEFVALLEDFAEQNRLPVDLNTPVTELVKDGGAYRLATPRGTLWARNVVIASGSLNRPRRPVWSGALQPDLFQIDASDYRSPTVLPPGSILIVGSGQSGGQIAEDLLEAGRRVFLATGHIGRFARTYRGRHIITWLVESGFMDVPRQELMDVSGRIWGRPLLGAVHTISLQSLSARGVVLLGRFTGTQGRRLAFADNLNEHIRFADESSAHTKCHIDDYIRRARINAPAAEPDPAETVVPCLSAAPIRALDAAACGITTVIWCTGFEGDFSWVRVPGVLDVQEQPVHQDGVAAVPGIYFAGLDFASTRKSGTILAVAEEADRLVRQLTAVVRS
jgi:putative flavoprotein involved in K+ transport